ncbi:MAG: hypothetical protein ACK4Z5_03830 [Brevundimonas sp.]
MRAVFSILGMAALAACAAAPEPANLGTGGAAPLPTPGKDWFFHADAGGAMLAYGVEASDDLSLRFDCAPGSGRTQLLQPAPAPAGEILIEAGGETDRWPAAAEPSELDDGVNLIAEAETSRPVFQRFRRLGWLAIFTDGDRRTLVAQPGSADRIDRYFKACE